MANVSRDDVLAGFRDMLGDQMPGSHANSQSGVPRGENSTANSGIPSNLDESITAGAQRGFRQAMGLEDTPPPQQAPRQTAAAQNNSNVVQNVQNAMQNVGENVEQAVEQVAADVTRQAVEQAVPEQTRRFVRNLDEMRRDNPVTQIRDVLNSVPMLEIVGLILAIIAILNAIKGGNLMLSAALMIFATLAHAVGQTSYTKSLGLGSSSGNQSESQESQNENNSSETSENEE